MSKIQPNSAPTIGVIGLGYVGLPIALRFIETGHRVIGFDIDQSKISKIKGGKSYIGHISDDKVKHAASNGFEPTSDFSRIDQVNSIIICVPTPLNKYREPDMT